MHISQPLHNCHKPLGRRGNSEYTQDTSIGIHSNLSKTSVWYRNGHLEDALEQPTDIAGLARTMTNQKTRMQIAHPPRARSPPSSSTPLSQPPSISTPRCLSQCGSHKLLCKYLRSLRHSIPGSAGGGRCWCLSLPPCIHLVYRKDKLRSL